MRVGVIAPFVDGLITSGAFLSDYAGVLEECGVESVWTVEHVVVAETYESRYPYSPSGRMADRGRSTMTSRDRRAWIYLSCTTFRSARRGPFRCAAPNEPIRRGTGRRRKKLLTH